MVKSPADVTGFLLQRGQKNNGGGAGAASAVSKHLSEMHPAD
jgi:hypothetical protein